MARRFLRSFVAVAVAVLCGVGAPAAQATGFSAGELVRLTRSETLMFNNEKFLGAPKGQEFSVLKHDAAQGLVYVAFYKEDGSLVAVTLPADALEASPPDGWSDLLRGVEAFRDGRFNETKRLLARAAQDETYRALAAAIGARMSGVLAATSQTGSGGGRQLLANTLRGLRQTAEQLCKLGHFSLALPIEQGADRLANQLLSPAEAAAAPSKVDRVDLTRRATESHRAVWRSRQAAALHRLVEASKYIAEGLKAEPARPELKALQTRVQKEMEEAEDSYVAANKMRTRGEKGVIHALSALDRGLRLCSDHPKLRELRKEMQASFEERTAPPVTPAFLAALGASKSREALEEGHRLYTTRCTECHDLELLDSRTATGWQRAVSGMARRAGLNEAQQNRILEYLTVAQNSLEAKDE